MGKHKHSKDKLYVSQSELKGNNVKKSGAGVKSYVHPLMPYDYCCISQRPFTDPYCDENGNLYDKKSVLESMAFEKAQGKTEYSIDIHKLIKVNFHKKNRDFICPVTRKIFNRFSKIVINKKTGYVYSAAAIKELCKNEKEMFDPLTHEPMSKSDLIILQNYIRKGKKWEDGDGDEDEDEDEDGSKKFPFEKSSLHSMNIRDSGAVNSVLQEVAKQKKEKDELQKNIKEIYIKKEMNTSKSEAEVGVEAEDENENETESESENELKIKCQNYSNNALAQSVTSTVYDRVYTNEILYLSEKETFELIYKEVRNSKRSCYVSLITDLGVINLELYASIYPRLCHNFLLLCEYTYYDKTEIFKLDDNLVYFGSQKKNYHLAASGFYWRSKIKKKNLRRKIRKKTTKNAFENSKTKKMDKTEKEVEENEGELEILKFKEALKDVKSDNDSDIDIKYVKYNDNRHIGDSDPFAVGGHETLKKLRNINFEKDCENYRLMETIIYTNPFKDIIKQMKRKYKMKEENDDRRSANGKTKEKEKEKIKVLTDEELVENKDDVVGKYIDWEKLDNREETTEPETTQRTRADLMKKLLKTEADLELSTTPGTTSNSFKGNMKRMTFDCW